MRLEEGKGFLAESPALREARNNLTSHFAHWHLWPLRIFLHGSYSPCWLAALTDNLKEGW